MKKYLITAIGLFISASTLANDDLFSQLDTNSDGLISVEEASADSSVAASFTELDINKDGYLSALEFAEL